MGRSNEPAKAGGTAVIGRASGFLATEACTTRDLAARLGCYVGSDEPPKTITSKAGAQRILACTPGRVKLCKLLINVSLRYYSNAQAAHTAALGRAKSLIQQLKYEGYSKKDAEYAVDAIKVNWKQQAVKSAKSYLETSSFSRSSRIEQLEYEGFTHEQAIYGVKKAY